MTAEVQTDLVAFLLACIEEDAQAAREVGRGSPWGIAETKPPRWGEDSPDTEIIGDGKPIATFNEETAGYLTALHVERWDPARVLVECDTKRRIIELHAPGHECSVYDQRDEVDACRYLEDQPCSTLLLLAQPFAGRPGFRDEWRSVQVPW